MSVADNSTTSFYARASDGSLELACSTTSVTNVEDSTPPDAPSVLAVAPNLPANDNTPTVSVSVAEAPATVQLYTDDT